MLEKEGLKLTVQSVDLVEHTHTHTPSKTKETQYWDLLVLKLKRDIFRQPLTPQDDHPSLCEENKLTEIQTLMRS